MATGTPFRRSPRSTHPCDPMGSALLQRRPPSYRAHAAPGWSGSATEDLRAVACTSMSRQSRRRVTDARHAHDENQITTVGRPTRPTPPLPTRVLYRRDPNLQKKGGKKGGAQPSGDARVGVGGERESVLRREKYVHPSYVPSRTGVYVRSSPTLKYTTMR